MGTSAVQGAGTNIRFDASGQIWLSYNLFNFDIQGRPNVVGKWDTSNMSSFKLMARTVTQSPTSAPTLTGAGPAPLESGPARRSASANAGPRRSGSGSGSGSPTAGPTSSIFSLVFPGGEEYVPSNPVPAECFPGTYKDGDFRCKDCPMGKSSHAKNQARCVECGVGTYSSAEGQPECTQCPTGSTTWSDGAISQVQCMCEQDYFDKAIRFPLFNASGCKSTLSQEFNDCRSAKETESDEIPPNCAPLGDLAQMDLQATVCLLISVVSRCSFSPC